jgi:glycogen debranching enzyme
MNPFQYSLIVDGETFIAYKAGIPGYERSFTRDTIMSALLADDVEMMKNALKLCAKLQGQTQNPFTSEEKGKIYHEYPGVDLNGKNTMYAACDTTALFLIGIDWLVQKTGDETLIETYKTHIVEAVTYIKSHIKGDLFWEEPRLSSSETMALKVTYWKDSSLQDRQNGDPIFPVCFTFAHFQNLAGLRAAHNLFPELNLEPEIEELKQGIHTLFNTEKQQFILAKDGEGEIFGISDDFLHGLYYLEPGDLTPNELTFIEATIVPLETDFGIRTNSNDKCDINSRYHSCSLWPFEQGFIAMGARKFGLEKATEIAGRIESSLSLSPEFCYIDMTGKILEKAGNMPQLWTYALQKYFENQKPS